MKQPPPEPTLAEKALKIQIRNILKKLNDGKTISAREQQLLKDHEEQQNAGIPTNQHPLDPSAEVRTAALVELLGVSHVTVAQLAKDGVLKRKKTGVYYALDSIKNYIAYIRKNRKTKHGAGNESNQELRDMLIREQARKERALASLRELELEMKEKSLVPESDLLERLSDCLIPLRRLLDALPKAVASQANPGEPNVAEVAIRKGLDQRVFSEIQRIMKKTNEDKSK